MKHLHDYDLVHMDIKPENIFISDEDTCKLGDFGLVLDLSKVCFLARKLQPQPAFRLYKAISFHPFRIPHYNGQILTCFFQELRMCYLFNPTEY